MRKNDDDKCKITGMHSSSGKPRMDPLPKARASYRHDWGFSIRLILPCDHNHDRAGTVMSGLKHKCFSNVTVACDLVFNCCEFAYIL